MSRSIAPARRHKRAAGLPVYALAVLAGAVLVFQIQPIAGRLLLPRYGGGASVWTACMFFFQVMLLAGYAYAQLLSTRLAPRAQAIVHASLMLVSLIFLPATVGGEWVEAMAAEPAVRIVLTLLVDLGVPFALLASTAPLIQRWSSLTRPGRSPYRLYALSNLGAVLALVAYPLAIEPNFDMTAQTRLWSAGYLVFFAVSLGCCLALWRHAPPAAPEATMGGRASFRGTPAWLTTVFAACGVVALLVVTAHITRNVAPVPFLWILPLLVYLLTYIFCFAGGNWYDRAIWGSLFVVAGTTFLILDFFGTAFPILPAVLGWLLVLFFVCMLCHAEIYRLRPEASLLGRYYLLIAAGGAAGGAAVTLLAPEFFIHYWEGPLAVYVAYLGLGVAVISEFRRQPPGSPVSRTGASALQRAGAALAARQARLDFWMRRLFIAGWSGGALLLPLGVFTVAALRPTYDVASERNFYGVLNVRDIRDDEAPRRLLVDGTTIHGFQYLAETSRSIPTSYYARDTGIGRVLERPPGGSGRHIGVIGLGTGTLAAYGGAGDRLRFYELNPAVADIAERYFSFLADTSAEIDVVLGDARISLEHELARDGGRNYDVLVVDAFTSDAIPVHLLTLEALQLYDAHVRDGGVIAFHVTNNYLDLAPVIANAAAAAGKSAILVSSLVDSGMSSWVDWLLLVDEGQPAPADLNSRAAASRVSVDDGGRVWTDAYSNLLATIKRR